MQLGSRWTAGEPPHPGVPDELLHAITAAEHEHPEGRSWTLTWLEGRPRVELLDGDASVLADFSLGPDGLVRTGTADGIAAVSSDDDDDDWLS